MKTWKIEHGGGFRFNECWISTESVEVKTDGSLVFYDKNHEQAKKFDSWNRYYEVTLSNCVEWVKPKTVEQRLEELTEKVDHMQAVMDANNL